MKQVLISSILIVVIFIQLSKAAEENDSLTSEDVSDILSAESGFKKEYLQKQKRGRQW